MERPCGRPTGPAPVGVARRRRARPSTRVARPAAGGGPSGPRRRRRRAQASATTARIGLVHVERRSVLGRPADRRPDGPSVDAAADPQLERAWRPRSNASRSCARGSAGRCGGSSLVGEQRERRRVGRALRGVEHPGAVRRRLGAAGPRRITSLTFRVGHPPVVVPRSRPAAPGSSLCTPLPVSAEILSTGASPRNAQPVADLVGDVEPRCSASSSSHLLSSDDDRAAGGVDALGQALVLVR